MPVTVSRPVAAFTALVFLDFGHYGDHQTSPIPGFKAPVHELVQTIYACKIQTLISGACY